MDIDFCVKIYLQNYNSLLDQISLIFTEDYKEYNDYLILLKEESKDKKWMRGIRFNQQINDDNFNIFIESKIKLFSHKDDDTKKISECLFDSHLPLKKIFNNRDDNIKNILWHYLHLMFLMIESAQKKQNKEKIKKLSKLIEQNEEQFKKSLTKIKAKNEKNIDPKSMIKEIFNVDVNSQTNDMLNDIISSFESSGSMNNMNNFAGILSMAETISTKYKDKINNGEIELNKIMEGITDKVPALKEIIKSTDGMFGTAPAKKEEPIIINENFSTANIELGEVKIDKEGFNIGKMLKLADSMGVLPGLPGIENNESSLDPTLKDLFGMITNIGDLNNKDNLDSLKTKMDNFLSNQGIDISQLNNSINSLMETNNENDSNNEDKSND